MRGEERSGLVLGGLFFWIFFLDDNHPFYTRRFRSFFSNLYTYMHYMYLLKYTPSLVLFFPDILG